MSSLQKSPSVSSNVTHIRGKLFTYVLVGLPCTHLLRSQTAAVALLEKSMENKHAQMGLFFLSVLCSNNLKLKSMYYSHTNVILSWNKYIHSYICTYIGYIHMKFNSPKISKITQIKLICGRQRWWQWCYFFGVRLHVPKHSKYETNQNKKCKRQTVRLMFCIRWHGAHVSQ